MTILTIDLPSVDLEEMQVLTNDQIIHLTTRENHGLLRDYRLVSLFSQYFITSEN